MYTVGAYNYKLMSFYSVGAYRLQSVCIAMPLYTFGAYRLMPTNSVGIYGCVLSWHV